MVAQRVPFVRGFGPYGPLAPGWGTSLSVVPDREGVVVKLSSVAVFVGTYALFLVSGYLFRIDLVYYEALIKPAFTPPGAVIGIVWAVLFAMISLALAALDSRIGIANIPPAVAAVIVANWFFNQAYSYVQFVRKDWLLAALDSGLVALTAFAFVFLVWKISRASAWLFVPYALWASFATYLSYAVWALNR
jgi:translocator protein